MEEDGMKEIKNSSEYFLSERDEKNAGSMVVPFGRNKSISFRDTDTSY